MERTARLFGLKRIIGSGWNGVLRVLILSGILMLPGCGTQTRIDPVPTVATVDSCREYLTALDDAIESGGVRDAAYFRHPSYPFLRFDRFLAALETQGVELPGRRDLIRRMVDLDREAREREIANLPREQIERLGSFSGGGKDRNRLSERTARCAELIFARHLEIGDLTAPGLTLGMVGTEYSSAMRTVGLYPITSKPVAYLTRRAHDRLRRFHETSFDDLPRRGRLIAYLPEAIPGDGKEEISVRFGEIEGDAAGLPRMTPRQELALAGAFAPVFVQDTAAGYDRPGEIHWQGTRIAVDTVKPVVYYYLSHTFFNNRPAMQVNYVFWYSERKGPDAPWIEWGSLDGVTFRITLDAGGTPIMADGMNNCGCYHFFFPRESMFQIAPDETGLYPFVPAWLPQEFPERRIVLRINSGWHQVDHVGTRYSASESIEYRLVPYSRLESLPRKDGSHQSLFSPEGIARGSGRIEPILLFPMGVHDVGSMRQRGHHAIKLVGEAHFDDPFLIDRHFRLK